MGGVQSLERQLEITGGGGGSIHQRSRITETADFDFRKKCFYFALNN